MAGPIALTRPTATLNSRERAQVAAYKAQARGLWSFPYYSRVRFTPVRSGAGPFVWTLNAGTRVTAFAYARNGDMTAAGRAGVAATAADTNLQSPGETIGGQELEIKRIATQLQPNSEPAFAKHLWPEVSVSLSLDGGLTTIQLGTLAMLPGGATLVGSATSALQPQPIPGGRPEVGVMANGWAVDSNDCPVPEGLVWQKKGEADSNLAIIFTCERDVVYTGQLADEVAAAGIRGYTNPPAQALQAPNGAIFCDLMVKLKGGVRSNLSVNG